MLKEEMIGTVLKEGVKFKNLVTKDLTRLAFFLKIMVSNILPQVGHLYEIENFRLYVLWNIITPQKINLPILMHNHLFRHRNKIRAFLPYVRLLAELFVKKVEEQRKVVPL